MKEIFIENTKMLLIVLITTMLTPIIVMLISGSRTSGIGLGLILGVGIGNLIYSVFFYTNKMIWRLIIGVLISCFVYLIYYLVINYLQIDNIFLIILFGCVIPLLICWLMVYYVSLRTSPRSRTKKR